MDKTKMKLVYNGVDLSRFNHIKAKSNLRKKFKIPLKALVLTAVGNLSPAKGTEDLLKAFAVICKKHDNKRKNWSRVYYKIKDYYTLPTTSST